MPTSEVRRRKREEKRERERALEKERKLGKAEGGAGGAAVGSHGHSHSHGAHAHGTHGGAEEEKAKSEADMTPEERAAKRAADAAKCEALKQEGNDLHKAGSGSEALEKYEAALQLALRLNDAVAAGTLASNMSAVLLQLGQWDASLQFALQAMQWRPLWAKPYYRLGEALRFRGMWGRAKGCYEESLKHNPDDKHVLKKMQEMEELEALVTSTAHLSVRTPIIGAVLGVIAMAGLAVVDARLASPTLNNPVIVVFLAVVFALVGGGIGFVVRHFAAEARVRRLEPPANEWSKERGLEPPFTDGATTALRG
eukprot:CAMPEP_0203822742 /NCGR_PEP_ID=MMETSP0115-20131106/47136_1 /ASSEMBLY_ACC=CAM_ASM_000227 /TAXON_ID=33651 /ORGANISM="Bicosoecid sp, Strain ms1" /LENGTH=310 /DNA_ID=CAMNT_0050731777 /DNA_START=21 /DNA_END=949 /DNA_ORIENTATION=+